MIEINEIKEIVSKYADSSKSLAKEIWEYDNHRNIYRSK